MAKGAKKGKSQMISLYGHLVVENFHASCYYQSAGQTEEGEAVGKEGNEVNRDSSRTNSLATEGSEINTVSPETSTVNPTVNLQCSGFDCLNADCGISELVHNRGTFIVIWMGLSKSS